MAGIQIHVMVAEGEEADEVNRVRKGLSAEKANAIMAKLKALIREELDMPVGQSTPGATLP